MLLLSSSCKVLIKEVELGSLQDVWLLVISLLSGSDFTKKGEESNISCVPGTLWEGISTCRGTNPPHDFEW